VLGQIVADLAELLVDDVEVVDQPLGGRRDRTLRLDGAGEQPVGIEQRSSVLADAGPDRVPARGRRGDR
jgi:hypothetical protein